MIPMREGAIAMVDALGIKGIWRGPAGKEDTRAVRTLETALNTAQSIQKYFDTALIPRVVRQRFSVDPVVRILSLSDTIVVAAVPPDEVERPDLRWSLVDLVCQAASYVMRFAAQADPPLVYRGAVNFGRLLIHQSFLLGPAVDEVAEVHQIADGAFVWLMPAADALEASPYRPNVWKTMALRYSIPLKDGRSMTTTAISPFADTAETQELSRIRAGYEMAMKSERVDVTIKRQNTMPFLDKAIEHVRNLPAVT